MHRVDTQGHNNNRFQSGTPQLGQEGTILTEAWLNDVQENLCEVIEEAGIALVKGDPNQLRLAISAMITAARQAQPVGQKVEFDGPCPAITHLPLDGGQYLRADYPALVAYYQAQNRLIAGDTAAQFRVPNYMGRFARAWSSDGTVDPDGPRAAGSAQDDALKSHTHGQPQGTINPTGSPAIWASGDDLTGATEATVPQTQATGGAETRPKNIAFLWAVTTGRVA